MTETTKTDRAACRPLPAVPRPRLVISREPMDPACEMCGHPVMATHCKRICLHCGFMTGCSEGV